MFLYSGDKFIFVINLGKQDLRIVLVGHLLKTKKKHKNSKKQEIQDVFIKANYTKLGFIMTKLMTTLKICLSNTF